MFTLRLHILIMWTKVYCNVFNYLHVLHRLLFIIQDSCDNVDNHIVMFTFHLHVLRRLLFIIQDRCDNVDKIIKCKIPLNLLHSSRLMVKLLMDKV